MLTQLTWHHSFVQKDGRNANDKCNRSVRKRQFDKQMVQLYLDDDDSSSDEDETPGGVEEKVDAEKGSTFIKGCDENANASAARTAGQHEWIGACDEDIEADARYKANFRMIVRAATAVMAGAALEETSGTTMLQVAVEAHSATFIHFAKCHKKDHI
uniref:Uncharacterized protein n=1 Tax=Pseudictyota dubia TaxID=2749911 RepID=A0A7R9WDH3_9STRA|mmetsp:Transcript_43356/g.80638  ORF Transcript_43356/g.80638 Transcript_43356/m.80638 type:complete len:157 (+) Transcript_43356:472-942(+)